MYKIYSQILFKFDNVYKYKFIIFKLLIIQIQLWNLYIKYIRLINLIFVINEKNFHRVTNEN